MKEKNFLKAQFDNVLKYDLKGNNYFKFYSIILNYTFLRKRAFSSEKFKNYPESLEYILPFPDYKYYVRYSHEDEISNIYKNILSTESSTKIKTKLLVTTDTYQVLKNKINLDADSFEIMDREINLSYLKNKFLDNYILVLDENLDCSVIELIKKCNCWNYYWVISDCIIKQCSVHTKTVKTFYECEFKTNQLYSIYIYALLYHRIYTFIKMWNKILNLNYKTNVIFNILIKEFKKLTNYMKMSLSLLFWNFIEDNLTSNSPESYIEKILDSCDTEGKKILLQILTVSNVNQNNQLIKYVDSSYSQEYRTSAINARDPEQVLIEILSNYE